MKTKNLSDTLLDEARNAEPSEQLGSAIDKIKERIGAMILERDELHRAQQDAIAIGRDQAKAQAAIDAHDTESTTLEAALASFARRHDELRKQEDAAENAHLKSEEQRLANELAAVTDRYAIAVRTARAEGLEMAQLAKALGRINDLREGKGQRVEQKASTVVRTAIGELPNIPADTTGYGNRIAVMCRELLSDNPAHLRKSHDIRRGRFGETNAFKDQIAAGILAIGKPAA